MSKLGIFLLVFCILEISLLVSIGGALGVVLTILWFIGSAFFGMSLLRGKLSQLKEKFSQGLQNPRNILFQEASVAVLLAAVFLILPGFFTDGVALALLLLLLVKRFTQQGSLKQTTSNANPRARRREIPIDEYPTADQEREVAKFEILPDEDDLTRKKQ